jgi:hypothetical protein
MSEPVVGKFYRHFRGDLYAVLHLARDVDRFEDDPTVVIYHEVGDPDRQIYVRTIKSWRSTTPSGVERFVLEDA